MPNHGRLIGEGQRDGPASKMFFGAQGSCQRTSSNGFHEPTMWMMVLGQRRSNRLSRCTSSDTGQFYPSRPEVPDRQRMGACAWTKENRYGGKYEAPLWGGHLLRTGPSAG